MMLPTQTEQLQILQDLAKKLWLAYMGGDMSHMQKALTDKVFRKDTVESLEFFINQEYAQHAIGHDVEFPSCVKPNYFLHLCGWSRDFRNRHKENDIPLKNMNLYQVVLEKRCLLKVFSQTLNQATVDKFEKSFNSDNEELNNFQTLVFKLAKRELGFEEDLKTISQVYFNDFSSDKVKVLKANILEVTLSVEFNDQNASRLKDKNLKEPKKMKI